MGAYVNPPDMPKEDWLKRSSSEWSYLAPTHVDEKNDGVFEFLPVCLVDNYSFTAAGIAFDDRELEAFKYNDGRRKIWFWVEKSKLLDPEVSSLAHYIKV